MLHLGMVNYLNALPLHTAFNCKSCKLTFDVPTALNALLKARILDGSLVSSVEYLKGDYQLLSSFGIAANAQVDSVNLYIKESCASLHQAKIGVTLESATSATLLKILCHEFWKVSPIFLPLKNSFEEFDAVLLIGDQALHRFTLKGYKKIDLAEAWVKETNLPFIFAVFAFSKTIEESLIKKVEQRLEFSVKWFEENREKVIEHACKQSSLSREFLSNYYQKLHYRLTPRDFDGLKLFGTFKYVQEIPS